LTPRGLIGDREASDLAPVQRPWTAGTKIADSGSSMVEARRSGCPGGHASAPRGLISDRKASDLTPAQLQGITGAADGVRRSGCPGGHASTSQGLISDRKASDLEPSLSSATGSANCGLHVMVKQARNRQFEYLYAQQEALEDENGDEYWSNSQRGHDPVELLDLAPMRCGAETETIDSDEILMSINITGLAHLQRCIRNLCSKYINTFSPTVKIELARVPPLSMKVALDKWKDKRRVLRAIRLALSTPKSPDPR
jgi:hypothetical protein